jgi:hypothetical protein
VGDELTWGWACLLVGTVRLVALAVNGAWVPPTFHIRSVTSALSCFFWFSISLGMAVTGAATTGLAVYPWLLVGDLVCLYRTARDYRVSILAMRVADGEVNAASRS